MLGRKKSKLKPSVEHRADNLRALAARVTRTVTAIMPSPEEVTKAVRTAVCQRDPWANPVSRTELTAIAARLSASNSVVLGLIGGQDGLLLIGDELAAGLAERGFPGEMEGLV